MCYLTVVEKTWTPEVGTWHRKEEEQMFIDFIAKYNYPHFWTLHTTYSRKRKTMGSALCVLVDILGVPPDLTYIFWTATFQHCKQQPSECGEHGGLLHIEQSNLFSANFLVPLQHPGPEGKQSPKLAQDKKISCFCIKMLVMIQQLKAIFLPTRSLCGSSISQ